MNRKGFTLIELLAVIVVLSGITLVVIGSVSSSLLNREQKECKEQMELAKNAAKIYFSLDKTGSGSVSVAELISGDYLDDKKANLLEETWIINISNGDIGFQGETSLKCKDL